MSKQPKGTANKAQALCAREHFAAPWSGFPHPEHSWRCAREVFAHPEKRWKSVQRTAPSGLTMRPAALREERAGPPLQSVDERHFAMSPNRWGPRQMAQVARPEAPAPFEKPDSRAEERDGA